MSSRQGRAVWRNEPKPHNNLRPLALLKMQQRRGEKHQPDPGESTAGANKRAQMVAVPLPRVRRCFFCADTCYPEVSHRIGGDGPSTSDDGYWEEACYRNGFRLHDACQPVTWMVPG